MLAAIPSQALWYASRGAGVVLLVVLSAALVLGVAVRAGWLGERGQRFVAEALHRNLALLAVALLVVHVVTAVVDPFVHVGWLATVVPGTSRYRTLWIALGALSLDAFLAVVVTSLLRRRMRQRGWRLVHWLTWVAWPLAFVHSLYAGDDMRLSAVAVVYWACAAAVVGALAARLRIGGRPLPDAPGPAAGLRREVTR